ncbi:nuclear transport factor 2 family protein [Embleya sp. MST-111070]|uniref:nuclear transport factor 2 family protein n=1 Tax=Embleya sp. MST-111070 TaxID=3398231 RepID=UPI003F73C0D0
MHTQHVHGDRAKGTANQLVYFHHGGEPPHRAGGLHVAGAAVRTREGLRFGEVRITLAWTHDA